MKDLSQSHDYRMTGQIESGSPAAFTLYCTAQSSTAPTTALTLLHASHGLAEVANQIYSKHFTNKLAFTSLKNQSFWL